MVDPVVGFGAMLSTTVCELAHPAVTIDTSANVSNALIFVAILIVGVAHNAADEKRAVFLRVPLQPFVIWQLC